MTDPEQVVIPEEMVTAALHGGESFHQAIVWLLDQPKGEHAQEYLERMFLKREEMPTEMPEEWFRLMSKPCDRDLCDCRSRIRTVEECWRLHLASKETL